MKVLGFETTCDETAVSIVEDGHHILTNLIASQIDIHAEFGGVFPEIASREHVGKLLPLLKGALKKTGLIKEDIDAIAVASNPGLIGSIVTGVSVASALALAWNKPLYRVNHVHAHLVSPIMGLGPKATNSLFPALGIVLSGGHTFFAKMSSPDQYKILSETVDDAMGEAFDKVASILDLGYPGGPKIEKLASLGDSSRFPFKAGRVKGMEFHFSFSGLKTNVFYTVKELKKANGPLSEQDKCDIAASFQKVACYDIINKAEKLASSMSFQSILIGGGVSASRYFRHHLNERFAPKNIPVHFPGKGLSTDNAAMIAGLAYFQSLSN